jgi:hypothetical protein
MLAEKPNPRDSSDCEEVLLYRLTARWVGFKANQWLDGVFRQNAGKLKLPFGAADSFLHVLFFAGDCQVQHHKPTQDDGNG